MMVSLSSTNESFFSGPRNLRQTFTLPLFSGTEYSSLSKPMDTAEE